MQGDTEPLQCLSTLGDTNQRPSGAVEVFSFLNPSGLSPFISITHQHDAGDSMDGSGSPDSCETGKMYRHSVEHKATDGNPLVELVASVPMGPTRANALINGLSTNPAPFLYQQREMTDKEKHELMQSIICLPKEMLGRVTEIIMIFMPNEQRKVHQKCEEPEIDLDDLSPLTLWELERYIKWCNLRTDLANSKTWWHPHLPVMHTEAGTCLDHRQLAKPAAP
jgi:hypothetical protein